jgi:Sec-independent protein translocase protein TatA
MMELLLILILIALLVMIRRLYAIGDQIEQAMRALGLSTLELTTKARR